MDRVLTLHDGETGRNLRVALGTILATLVPGKEPEKIILGGPMMGRTASTLQDTDDQGNIGHTPRQPLCTPPSDGKLHPLRQVYRGLSYGTRTLPDQHSFAPSGLG